MKLRWNILLSVIVLACAATAVRADVRLAGVFGDHMVLQRDAAVPVWGWAKPESQITVAVGQQSASAKADQNGKWIVKLEAMKAGGPLEMKVTGDGEVVVEDILVGEVWLCSGQSNMAMTVSRAKDFPQEKANSNLPMIRHFKTAAHATGEMQEDCEGAWVVCSPDSVGSFTATGFFFGREIHQALDVPVGLVNSSWGGTDVASWTSLSAQQSQEAIQGKLKAFDEVIAAYDAEAAKSRYETALRKWEQRRDAAKASGKKVPRKPKVPTDPRKDQNRPANLYNGMIHPLIPYSIRGAIWYQGERNSHSISDGALYETQLKTLIQDWRQRWGQGDFPFGTVQLPNFHAPQKDPVETTGWVMVRESELKTLELPNTGIAVTTDIGMANNIHPTNKQTVGQRLALWARAKVYDQAVEFAGPMLTSHSAVEGNTNDGGKATKAGKIVLIFDHAQGLQSSDNETLKGFAIAGENKEFHRANASVNSKTGRVVVRSKDVPNPVAVRYNWADNPEGNLVNEAGLPASPFRTDDWNVGQ